MRGPLPSRLAPTHHNKEQKAKKKKAASWEEKQNERREGKIFHNADIHVTGEKHSLLLACHGLRLNIKCGDGPVSTSCEDHGGVQTSGQLRTRSREATGAV